MFERRALNSTTDLWKLPHDLRGLVENELGQDEALTWIGQPMPRFFGMRSLSLFLFGIPCTAFALFWIVGAAGFEIPDFDEGFDWFPLFGVPFVLIGFGMLSSPIWSRLKARKTVYVVTDRRAIMFDGGFSTTIRSFGPDRLDDIRRRQRRDGSGDLIFEKEISYDSEQHRHSTDIGFIGIADVKQVEDLVRDVLRAAQNGGD